MAYRRRRLCARFSVRTKLEKVDGKVGRQTLAVLFGDDVIALPTPTPSPDAVPVADPRSDGNPCSYACADRDAGFGERAVCDAESQCQHRRKER